MGMYEQRINDLVKIHNAYCELRPHLLKALNKIAEERQGTILETPESLIAKLNVTI